MTRRNTTTIPPFSQKSVDGQMRLGSYVSVRRRTYWVDAPVDWDTRTVALRDEGTGECIDISLMDLLICQDGVEPTVFAPTLAVLEARLEQARAPVAPATTGGVEEFLDDVDEIIRVVEIVDAAVKKAQGLATAMDERFLGKTAAIDAALADPANDIQVGRAMYYRYLARYRQCAGSRARLAASFKRVSRHRTTLGKSQVHFVDVCMMRYHSLHGNVAEFYRDMERAHKRTGGLWPDVNKCDGPVPHDLVDALLNKKIPLADILAGDEKRAMLSPIALPSYPWVANHAREIQARPDAGKAIILDTWGTQVWEREYMVFDTFAHLASLPLQYVFLDHYKMDVYTLDEAKRRKRSRLWLTVAIDAYSRCVLGYALLYEDPCIESVQSALRDVIWPSSEKRPYCGIPQMLFLDNAWAHHSHSLENLAREIGCGGEYNTIELVFRPPYQARKGALIERFFGNLSRKIKDRLKGLGAILSRDPEHLRNAMADAALLYRDVERFVDDVLHEYHHTFHSALGMTPHERWVEGTAELPLAVPPLTKGMERLFWRMDPRARVMSSKGICIFGMHYWFDKKLANGVKPRITRTKNKVYTVHYRPSDISCIAIFHEGEYLFDLWAKELRRPDESYRPTSLAEWEIFGDLVALRPEAATDHLDYIEHLADTGKIRAGERRRLERAALRAEAEGSGAPSDTGAHRRPGRAGAVAPPSLADVVADSPFPDGGEDLAALATAFGDAWHD